MDHQIAPTLTSSCQSFSRAARTILPRGLFTRPQMKTICISQQDDGAFSVYEEMPEAMEAAAPMPGQPPAMEEAAEPEAMPAASLDEALELARGMLSADQRSPEQQVMAGYNKGGAAPAKPTPQTVFGG